jgi:hypothetical protein
VERGVLVACAAAWLTGASCSRCGPEVTALDGGYGLDTAEARAGDPSGEPPRLPKHDWNGLAVMMREAEAREALEGVGFRLVPSRSDLFPVVDMKERRLRLVPIQGFSPPIVILETEKGESPLASVYGLRLFFHSNRLYAFQPVYFADPVDLVEPGDRAVAPDEMERRLLGTFGTPAWSGEGTVAAPEGERTTSMMAWQDADLIVLYRLDETERPPEYALGFFSPRGNRRVRKLVEKLAGGITGQDR